MSALGQRGLVHSQSLAELVLVVRAVKPLFNLFWIRCEGVGEIHGPKSFPAVLFAKRLLLCKGDLLFLCFQASTATRKFVENI
jgi:hypothetical protein